MNATSPSVDQGTIKIKLTLMMVLELFIWGAWLPLLVTYMTAIGFTSFQQAWIGSAFAIASIVGIFFSNQWADRNFSAEKFMAASHLLGGLAMLGLFFTRDFWPFFALMLVHSLVYVPTLSVANSLAFSNLKDPTKEYGVVRMGGTIGWILASWPLYFILKDKSGAEATSAISTIFLVSGIASIVLAGFCLTLPHTPPKKAATGDDRFAWLKAGKYLGLPFLFVLFVVTFIDSTIHNGYFVMAGSFLGAIGISNEWIMPVMSIGQIAEIVTMIFLGYVLKNLGWKWTMIIGILGHTARFAAFAFFSNSIPLIIGVQVLHGICYAFYFATVYIFIDKAFPKDARASAQGLFNLLILGLGDLAAKWIFIPLMKYYTTDFGTPNAKVDYHSLFLVPTGLSVLAAIILFIFFWPPPSIRVESDSVA